MDNLTQEIKDFFLEQYQGIDTSNTFLSFEPLGCIINPGDFRDPATGAFNPTLATEEISELADGVTAIGDVFMPGLDGVSLQYQQLIEGARFNPAAVSGDDKSDYIAAFGKARNEALKTLEDADRMSLTSAGVSYFPTTTSPDSWYDAASPIWGFKAFEVEKIVTAPAPSGSAVPQKRMSLEWRKLATEKLSPEINNELRAPVFSRLGRNIKGIESAVLPLKVNPVVVSPQPEGPVLATRHLQTSARFNRLQTFKAANTAVAPLSEAAGTTLHTALRTQGESTEIRAIAPFLSRRLVMNNVPVAGQQPRASLALNRDLIKFIVAEGAATESKPVESRSFHMSFEYCVVQVQRFWLDTRLFNYAKLWYALALEEGFFSSGVKGPENKGCLRAIPKAFIVIKNLKIKAAWSDSDLQDAKESVGLGFFNLMNSEVNGANELVNPSLQIVGWLCEAMPKMPVTNDPNLV